MQLLKPTVALFLVFNLVSSMVIRRENVTRFASYDDIEEIPHSVMGSEMMSNGSELVKMESQKGVNLIYDTTHFMIHFMIKL